MKQVLLKSFQAFPITVMLMFSMISQPAIANELLSNSRVAPEKPYTKVDFGFNNCNVQWGELLSGVSEADMVKLATEANANGFTYHPSLKYGNIMVGDYPEGCKSPTNQSWPLYLKNVSYDSLDSVLLGGGWRNQSDLVTMSDDDKRNTLIVELDLGSAENVPYLQSLNNNELIGSAALYILIRDNKIRTKEELSKMSLDDQRNTVIVEINLRSKLPVPQLQGMNNHELAKLLINK